MEGPEDMCPSQSARPVSRQSSHFEGLSLPLFFSRRLSVPRFFLYCLAASLRALLSVARAIHCRSEETFPVGLSEPLVSLLNTSSMTERAATKQQDYTHMTVPFRTRQRSCRRCRSTMTLRAPLWKTLQNSAATQCIFKALTPISMKLHPSDHGTTRRPRGRRGDVRGCLRALSQALDHMLHADVSRNQPRVHFVLRGRSTSCCFANRDHSDTRQ